MSAKYLNVSGTNQPFSPGAYLRFPPGRKPAAKDLWMWLLTEAEAEGLFQGQFSNQGGGGNAPRLIEFPEAANEDVLL